MVYGGLQLGWGKAMRNLYLGLMLFCVPMLSMGQDLPTAKRLALAPVDKVETATYKALDRTKLAIEDAQSNAEGLPPRYAVPQKVAITPLDHGLWEAAGKDHQVWRYRVKAAGALSLNFGFTQFRLPEGAYLNIYATDFSSRIRPFTAADNADHGQLWTPPLLTSDAMIELTVPNAKLGEVVLTLGQIGQGYRGFGDAAADMSDKMQDATCASKAAEAATDWLKGTKMAPSGIKSAEKSGSCNMDIVCVPTSGGGQFPEWRQTAKSVAAISTGGSRFCSGSLLNNTANDRKMLFVTAAHCTVTAANAPSLVTFWNYQNSVCRVPGSAASGAAGDGPLDQFNTGATHRITNSASDFTLVEMSQPANPAHDLYWAGWDKSAGDAVCTQAAMCAGIHHPNVQEKRITFVDVNMTTTSYNNPAVPGDGTHVHALWSTVPPIFTIPAGGNTGTSGNPPQVTEGGSSGSPLYNAQHRFIGQLHGGPSACGQTGGNLSDYYGRFSLSFVPAASFLDPTSTGATAIDGMGACTQPEVPANVTATPNGNNRIDVSWTAVPAAESYDVYRALGACGGSGYTLVGNDVVGTTYTDLNVSGGSTYSYKVVSYDQQQDCSSAQSLCGAGTAVGQCTLAPMFAGATSAQSANQSTCSINLAWAAAATQCAGPASYNVYRSLTTGFTPSAGNLIASGVSGTALNDPAVNYNVPYFYIVRAVDTSNSQADGNLVERSATPRGTVTPGNLVETFEGAGGYDNPGWTHQAIAGANDWTLSTAQSQTPTHSWNSVSLPSTTNRVLVSPEFGALAGTTLSFFHTFNFEGTVAQCYDAGTLEVSTNGGSSWTVLPDASFTAGGFNGTANSGFANPIGGKRAWCSGTIGAMTQVTANLGAYAGQNIKLRWHEGDDSSAIGTGWFVDSVTINNAGTAGVCTSGSGDNILADGFE